MNTNEKKMQQELLNSKLGISGSGYARYGAAMYPIVVGVAGCPWVLESIGTEANS